jgi:hypothetical protein
MGINARLRYGQTGRIHGTHHTIRRKVKTLIQQNWGTLRVDGVSMDNSKGVGA